MKFVIVRLSPTFRVFVTPEESFLPQDVDVELFPEAEFHTGWMNFVVHDVHHPGGKERRPSDQDHHPHLIMKKHLLLFTLSILFL